MKETYQIPAINLDTVREKIEKLNRRAAKLGVPGAILEEVRRWVEERKDEITNLVTETREWVEVTVEGE